MIVYPTTDYQSDTTVTAIPEELIQPESAGPRSSVSGHLTVREVLGQGVRHSQENAVSLVSSLPP